MTEEALVTIATLPTAVEASIARGALEAAGIPAFVPDEDVGSFASEVQRPGDTSAREALQKRVRLEYLAFFVPIVLGSASGLVLRRLGRRWRTRADAVGDPALLPRQGA